MSPRGLPLDVSLTVDDTTVRLAGAGVDVTASHAGVAQGLRNALYDVRRERSRRGAPPARDLAAGPGLVSLRRAGALLAESFLPGPVAAALGALVERAVAGTVALRIGVD